MSLNSLTVYDGDLEFLTKFVNLKYLTSMIAIQIYIGLYV